MDFYVNSLEETTKIGYLLGELVQPGDIICLTGDLGTGKTHITKGIARSRNWRVHNKPNFYNSKWIWFRKA